MFFLPFKSLLSAIAIISLISVGNAHANLSKSVDDSLDSLDSLDNLNSLDTVIHFTKGQISTTVTGQLSPKQNEHWYQFDAAGGQYTLINIAPLLGTPETANVGVLHMPNGAQDGTKGGIIYQGCLPTSGKYRLRIARNLMATTGKTAGYVAEIIILPVYFSQALCDDNSKK